MHFFFFKSVQVLNLDDSEQKIHKYKQLHFLLISKTYPLRLTNSSNKLKMINSIGIRVSHLYLELSLTKPGSITSYLL